MCTKQLTFYVNNSNGVALRSNPNVSRTYGHLDQTQFIKSKLKFLCDKCLTLRSEHMEQNMSKTHFVGT